VFPEGGAFPAYGADAVRFGLLAMSSTQDVRFSEERIAQGQRLANKLWNASRLVLTRVPDDAQVPSAPPAPGGPEDAWILSRLERAKADMARALEAFEFHRAALGLYDFVYEDLCDWYLELVKPRLYDGDPAAAAVALHVLAQTLALGHPLIPFVTEEIHAHIPGSEGLLAASPYPAADPGRLDEEAEALVARAIAAVQALRAWRDQVGAAPGRAVPARLDAPGFEATAGHVARLARFEWRDGDGAEAPVATVGVPGGAVAIFASDAVDTEAEARRTAERLARLDAEIARAEGKLANQRFVDRAPAAVVGAERDKLAALRAEREELA
jgi:valyl-tRNA synthetase